MHSALTLILYAISSSAGLILLKIGSSSGAPIAIINGKISLNLDPYVIGGVVLYGLSFGIYTYLIAKNDLGYIVPVSTALIYTCIFLASFILFKEVFTAFKILGILLILSGVVLLNLNK